MENLISDIVLVVHFVWILFIIFAFPVALILRSKGLRVIHTIALIFTVIMQATATLCPLTTLEEYLRRKGAPDFTYGGSFIISWLKKLIYIENLGVSLMVVYILTALYLIAVIVSYFVWPISGKKRYPRKQDDDK